MPERFPSYVVAIQELPLFRSF